MLLTTALLILFCVCIVALLWIRGRRGRGDLLPDAGVSTLVFPPESKFQASVLPRH